MSGSTSAPPGAAPEVMVRMWAIEGVQKSRKDAGLPILTPNDSANLITAAEQIAQYVLNGMAVQVKAP